MANSNSGFKIGSYPQLVKKFLVILVTASFLSLGAVSADTESTKKYGPVKSGQTLWGIAYKTRLKGVSRLKMMNALHKLNPAAFDKGNINRLKKGAILYIPSDRAMVAKILGGEDVEVVDEGTEGKDIEVLRTELSKVKQELIQSREALKGLQQESEKYKQVEVSLSELKKENEKLKSAPGEVPEQIKKELASVTEKLLNSQETIKSLEEEKKTLKANADKGVVKKLEKTEEELAAASEKLAEADKVLAAKNKKLAESQELLKTLAEKNKELQTDSLDPKLLNEAKQELAVTREELDEIKSQNELLRKQAAAADSSDEERKDANRKFSDTIAALNADIGQLRTRIKELEELEKLKDAHIGELQKSLDHATTVIKEQAEVNKKMYARLNQLEQAAENGVDETEDNAAAAMTDTGSSNPPPTSSGTDTAGIVNFADKAGAGSGAALAVSETIKHISPKFWLMLTLAGLLFVLALLWRVMSGHDEHEAVT